MTSFIQAAHAVGAEVLSCPRDAIGARLEALLATLVDELALSRDRPIHVARPGAPAPAGPFGIDIAVVEAALGIASLGAVLFDEPERQRLIPMTAEVTVALLDAADLVPTLFEALVAREPGPARLIVTGPSKTADIEGVLVTGVHGPRRFIVVLAT